MPKEEWGVKRVCPNCSTRFYDLQRDPMVCPACDHGFSLESLTNPKSRTLVTRRTEEKEEPTVEADPVLEDDVLDDDDDSSVDLDDDMLDDDDDDNVSLDEIADVPANDED